MPFLSALEVVYDDALYKSTFTLLYFADSLNTNPMTLPTLLGAKA